MSIGSPSFSVTIYPGCSGWEGTALMLVFIIWWLCVLHREFRFPQALLLVPAALVTMWISNSVRIAVLILIGLYGAPNVAMGGFHSEAGWIAFNCVALSFAVASRKVRWFTVRSLEPSVQEALVTSTTAAYLMPFLVILAVGMISRAVSSGFEWLYPLRLISGAAALWFFRSKYSEMDWNFDWFPIGLGGVVFLIWLALSSFSGNQTDHVIPSSLAVLPASLRIAWILCRITAAVFTVPLAEELAFRGFLIRRLIWRDFDALDPQAYTFLSVVISSIVFGLLHGSHWPAGTVAGLLYALAFLRRGRIGDATVAHATTNGCLAIWVLWTDDWSLW
jgi:exosortase E/protease (VPEID-CTERM system)